MDGKIVNDKNGNLYLLKEGKIIKINVKNTIASTSTSSAVASSSSTSGSSSSSTNSLSELSIATTTATVSSISTKSQPREIKIWSKTETIDLLSLYKENKDMFKIKRKLWIMIAEKLKENNIKATHEQCESRYKNLCSTFRNKMDKENRSGAGSERQWEYMDIMLDIHDQRANVFPVNISNAGNLPSCDREEQVVPAPGDNIDNHRKIQNKFKRSASESIMDLMKNM